MKISSSLAHSTTVCPKRHPVDSPLAAFYKNSGPSARHVAHIRSQRVPTPLPHTKPPPSSNIPTWPAATADDRDRAATLFETRRRRPSSRATLRPWPWQFPTGWPPVTGKPSGRRGSTGGSCSSPHSPRLAGPAPCPRLRANTDIVAHRLRMFGGEVQDGAALCWSHVEGGHGSLRRRS